VTESSGAEGAVVHTKLVLNRFLYDRRSVSLRMRRHGSIDGNEFFCRTPFWTESIVFLVLKIKLSTPKMKKDFLKLELPVGIGG
jgi:hypothetical protein